MLQATNLLSLSFLRLISNSFMVLGPKRKALTFMRKIKNFRTESCQSINSKRIEKQYSSSHFWHKTVIKRECCIYLYFLLQKWL